MCVEYELIWTYFSAKMWHSPILAALDLKKKKKHYIEDISFKKSKKKIYKKRNKNHRKY